MPVITLGRTRPQIRAWAVGVATAGAVAVAGTVLTASLTVPARGTVPVSYPPAPEEALLTTNEQNVSVVRQVYDPGQSSGWHAHSGVHAVAVLSGTLAVYDERCVRLTFDAGTPYVGGRQLHLATNETDVPVEMVVTYVGPVHAADSTRRASPPPSCTAV